MDDGSPYEWKEKFQGRERTTGVSLVPCRITIFLDKNKFDTIEKQTRGTKLH